MSGSLLAPIGLQATLPVRCDLPAANGASAHLQAGDASAQLPTATYEVVQPGGVLPAAFHASAGFTHPAPRARLSDQVESVFEAYTYVVIMDAFELSTDGWVPPERLPRAFWTDMSAHGIKRTAGSNCGDGQRQVAVAVEPIRWPAIYDVLGLRWEIHPGTGPLPQTPINRPVIGWTMPTGTNVSPFTWRLRKAPLVIPYHRALTGLGALLITALDGSPLIVPLVPGVNPLVFLLHVAWS